MLQSYQDLSVLWTGVLPKKSEAYWHQPQLPAQPDCWHELAKELDDKYLYRPQDQI